MLIRSWQGSELVAHLHCPSTGNEIMNDEPKPTEETSRPLEPQPRPELAETEPWQGESHQDASPGAPATPQRIGRHRIVGVLGRGGFGTVYRAHDEELERDVAIKVWRQDRFAGEEQVRRLLEEARTVAHLEKHPWIVKVHDVGRQEDGSCFVVLEYIDGHPLDQELRSHNLTPDRIWEIMIQVTSAIQHAHAQGLVHRDLKPSNVLLDADGNAHVADFGLAIDEQTQRFHAGEDGHAGILLRAATEGPPDSSNFIRIPLLDDTSARFASVGPMEQTAAVFRTAAPSPPVKGTPDVWHAMTIRAEGPRIRVQYEGRTVVDVDLERAKTGLSGHRRASGRIGLQNLGTWVEFRNLVVRRLRKLDVAGASSAPPRWPSPPSTPPRPASTKRRGPSTWACRSSSPIRSA
jgi:serine/threonine protein kinase